MTPESETPLDIAVPPAPAARLAAAAAAQRSPTEAAARMRASRPGNKLPEGVTIRDLMTYGRA